MKLRIGFDEFLPVKTLTRELPRVMERLRTGEVDQLVITKHSAPQAVLVSLQRYEELVSAAEIAPRG